MRLSLWPAADCGVGRIPQAAAMAAGSAHPAANTVWHRGLHVPQDDAGVSVLSGRPAHAGDRRSDGERSLASCLDQAVPDREQRQLGLIRDSELLFDVVKVGAEVNQGGPRTIACEMSHSPVSFDQVLCIAYAPLPMLTFAAAP